MIWKKYLGATFGQGIWGKILSNNGEYIRDARGKFIQYKILHRYYYTPTRLNKMGLIKVYVGNVKQNTAHICMHYGILPGLSLH